MLSVEQVLPVLVVCAHPERGNFEEANKMMLAFEENLGLIFPLIEIPRTSEDATVRRLALVLARRYFERVKAHADNQGSLDGMPDFSALKVILLEMLQKEGDQAVQMSICDVIEVFAAIVIEFGVWPELPAFAVELVQRQETFFIGFYLMTCIYGSLPNEDQERLRKPVGDLAIQCMDSDNLQLRRMAMDCMDTILDLIEDPDSVVMFDKLPEAYRSLAQKTVAVYKDPGEIASVFDSIGQTLFWKFPAFDSVSPSFCVFALRVIQDPSIEWPLRVSVHQLLEYGPDRIPEWYCERFVECLKATVSLTLEVCQADRSMTDYQFAADYLGSLAKTVESDDCMETVNECVKSLLASADPASQQTALFVLTCVVEQCADAVVDSPEFVLDIVSKGLGTSDEFICAAANDLLRTTAEVASACLAPSLDSVVECLMNKLNDVMFLLTLEVVLDEADHATSHLQQLVGLLVRLLAERIDYKENVLDCLAAAIKHANVDDNLFNVLFPVLTELIKGDASLSTGAFKCFAILAQVSPNSVMGQLDNIVGFMFSVPPEYQLSVVESLFRFIEKFPTNMEKYADNCMKLVKAVMAIEYSSDFTAEHLSARAAAIQCWAYMSPSDEEFQRQLLHMVCSFYIKDQKAGCAAVSIAAAAFAHAHVDTSGLLRALLKEARKQTDKDAAFEMINAIIALVQISSTEAVAAQSSQIHELVLGMLSGQYPSASSDGAELVLVPAICNLLYYWAAVMGQGFGQYISQYMGVFMAILSGRKKNKKGAVILALAQLGVAAHSQEILSVAASNAVQSVEMNHVLMRTSVLNALNLLVREVPASVAEGQPRFKPVVEKILGAVCQGTNENYALFEAAAGLWASCVVAYNWEADADTIVNILSHLDVDFEDDMGRSIDFAKLCAKIGETGNEALVLQVKRMATRLFTETEWHYSRTPVEIKQFLGRLLTASGSAADEIRQILEFNQRMLRLVLSRLESL